jgi:putative PIN family toxin of toxin-antitoxin system
MIVVIDTNILLVSISPQSKHHWIYKGFLNREYQLAISTEILLEYEEIIERFMGKDVAQSVVKSIAYAPNTVLVTRWFSWNLISTDPDDNKFVDAYIACGADYIITGDKHFDVVKNFPFPPVKILSIAEFCELINNSIL